jgi:putative MFS transporter
MEEEHFIPFGKLQKILVFICGGGWGVSNAVQVGLGVLLSQIHREWGVSYLQQSLVSVFTMVGMFVGSFFWGFVADRYGRRKAFSKVLIFVALGIAVAVFSPNVWMLASCYIIVGFGLGGSYAVDGNVFLEYCPPNKQYILTSLSSLSSLGSCLPPALSLIYLSLNTPYEWQLLQGSIGLIALIISIPRFWIQETPAFLLSKHRTTLVLNLVETMRKVEDRDSLVEKVLLATPKEITEERSIKEQIRCLFKKPLRNLTIFYSVIWGCSSFTFSGISSFMPVVLTRAGFDGSSVYETMLFQQFGEV